MRDIYFYLDGECSKEYGIALQSELAFSKPSRKYETQEISGRNGVLHFTQDVFSGTSAVASCYVLDKNNMHEKLSAATQWLLYKNGVRRLELPEEPDVYREVTIFDGFDTDNRINKLGAFDVQFIAGAECWLKSGETPVDVTNGQKIFNYWMPAKPLVQVFGTGEGTVTIGGKSIQITEITEPFYIDYSTENAYNLNMNLNNKIKTPQGFSVIPSGESEISWSGGVTGLKITPRWWRI